MKVSLNWLKEYIDLDQSPEKIGEILTDIGLEVEGMEEVESIQGGMRGIVIGYVKECGRHPNADRLSLTKVDIGNGEDLQIVCGANNIAAGQKVLVATVGTTLYSTEGEAWTIKKGKIRGETSEGMVCSEDEVGLGDDHSGIVVLPENAPVGTPASDYYDIETDYVYEIGLTPNRSDATNHIGVARDLAAYLKINENNTSKIHLPSVDAFKVDNQDLALEVIVENEEACPRYSGVSIKGITVKESPEWLQKRLKAIGVRPISNIVDITNFILHELGQPLHAFDQDKIKGNKVIVKTLSEGSSFTTLDEMERKLSDQDLMICNGASEGMCIGGVFGGIGSGVTESTQNIFLEAAHFNAKWIRRSSMRHNLRTDAAKVFEKGSDPNLTVYALKRAAMLIQELAGGQIASEVTDLYPNPIHPAEVTIRYARINKLIGEDIPPETVKSILDALDMDILEESDTQLKITIPTNKTDVIREVDVIEEILRIYGFNKVPIPAYIHTAINVGSYPDANDVRNNLGNYLANNGFNEMMAVSLSESKYYTELLTDLLDAEKLVYVNNTSNVQLDIMRPDMLISGLEAVLHNQNRQQPNIKLFEFGKTYQYGEEKKIVEVDRLSVFLSGDRYPESWLDHGQKKVSDFYTLKAYVHQILQKVGLEGFQSSQTEAPAFTYGLKYHRGPQVLVELGKVQPAILKHLDIKGEVFFAEFNWKALMKAAAKNVVSVTELNKYPSTSRDLALVIDNSVKFDDIAAIANKVGKKLIKDINLFDVYENKEQLGEDKKSYAVSFTFEDFSKTLSVKEVDKVMNRLIKEYEQKLQATIRR
jgi:phenylalanyl-tRNA synthetase beta chain